MNHTEAASKYIFTTSVPVIQEGEAVSAAATAAPKMELSLAISMLTKPGSDLSSLSAVSLSNQL